MKTFILSLLVISSFTSIASADALASYNSCKQPCEDHYNPLAIQANDYVRSILVQLGQDISASKREQLAKALYKGIDTNTQIGEQRLQCILNCLNTN